MKKYLITITLSIGAMLFTQFTLAQENLSQNLSGRILLQVESHGEAWYVYPENLLKYYLGRPTDAFTIMSSFGLGISHNELLEYLALNFPKRLSGRILLDVEQHGEAYYVYPENLKGYYLGRPADAFTIMRELSLGITDDNLNKITTGLLSEPPPTPSTPPPPPQACTICQAKDPDKVFSLAATAMREGDKTSALSFFTKDMQNAVEYTMDFLDDEGKFTLGNIMSGATLSSSTEEERTYSTEIDFSLGSYKVEVNFHLQKQEDDTWLLINL